MPHKHGSRRESAHAVSKKKVLRSNGAISTPSTEKFAISKAGSWPFGDDAQTLQEWEEALKKAQNELIAWTEMLDCGSPGMELYAGQKIDESKYIINLIISKLPQLARASAQSNALFWASVLPLAAPYISDAVTAALPVAKRVGKSIADAATMAAQSEPVQRAVEYFYPRPTSVFDESGRRHLKYPDRWWKRGKYLSPEEIEEYAGYYIPPQSRPA